MHRRGPWHGSFPFGTSESAPPSRSAGRGVPLPYPASTRTTRRVSADLLDREDGGGTDEADNAGDDEQERAVGTAGSEVEEEPADRVGRSQDRLDQAEGRDVMQASRPAAIGRAVAHRRSAATAGSAGRGVTVSARVKRGAVGAHILPVVPDGEGGRCPHIGAGRARGPHAAAVGVARWMRAAIRTLGRPGTSRALGAAADAPPGRDLRCPATAGARREGARRHGVRARLPRAPESPASRSSTSTRERAPLRSLAVIESVEREAIVTALRRAGSPPATEIRPWCSAPPDPSMSTTVVRFPVLER